MKVYMTKIERKYYPANGELSHTFCETRAVSTTMEKACSVLDYLVKQEERDVRESYKPNEIRVIRSMRFMADPHDRELDYTLEGIGRYEVTFFVREIELNGLANAIKARII